MIRTAAPSRAARSNSASQIGKWLLQFLSIKDERENVLAERQEELRLRLLAQVARSGEADDKGSQFLDLTEPIVFKNSKGKTFKFTALKRERHLTPANPTPDPELAEQLLRKKKLWITPAQQKEIERLQTALPYATISIDVDSQAVYQAYIRGTLTEKEYSSVLIEQRESWQFRPCE